MKGFLSSARVRYGAASAVATAAVLGFASSAFATETKTEEAVKTLTSNVGSEGLTIFLAVLVGITGLLTAIIVLKMGVRAIKSWIK